MRVAYLLVLAAVVGIAGCSKPEPPSPASGAPAAATETATVRQALTTGALYPIADDVDDGSTQYAGSSTVAWVGYSGSCSVLTASRARFMNLKFDLSSIPACATVTSASLTFTHSGCITCQNSGTMWLYRIGTGWTEDATAGGCSGAVGATGAAGGLTFTNSSSVAGLAAGSTGTFAFSVGTDIQTWVNGTANNGWQLRFSGGAITPTCGSGPTYTAGNWLCNPANGGTGCGGNKKTVSTREDATVANRPTLVVNYNLDNTKCNDGNACTDNVCGASGCIFPANDALACSDGKACTTDACVSGSCVATPQNSACSDANLCTTDTCNPASPSANSAGCVFTNNTLACNDGVACTQSDTCSAGACHGTPNNANCTDGNGCTTDTCTASGCVFTNNTLACNDGIFCTTGDTCSGGACAGTPTSSQCNDGNTCTTDVCSPGPGANANGCVYSNNTLACNDSVACTTGDVCSGGACAGVASNALCNDSNECTADVCTGTACTNTAVVNGTPCTWDSNVCHKNTCQGGACNTPNAGVSCRVGSCSGAPPNAVAVAPAVCTAAGACPAVTNVACGTSTPCNATNTACQGACALDTDCPGGYFCSGSTCAVQLTAGKTCSRSAQCGTGICVDSVCCTTTCGNGNPNDCQACNATGTCASLTGTACQDGNACTTADTCSAGTCVGGAAPNCNDSNACTTDGCAPATGCTHVAAPKGTACRNVAGPCDVAETCDGSATTCPVDKFQPNTLSCRAASCTSGTQTLAANCTGTSAPCPAISSSACTPYICGATACLKTCSTDTDCVSADYCKSGACVPKGTAGAACTAANQCTTSQCADGVCCNTACTGQCEACNLQGSVGACTPVSGQPVAPRTACKGDGSACAGFCNGTLTTACTYPGATTKCRAPSCTANVGTLPAVCSGTGSCPALQTKSCAPFVCGASACVATCTSDTECQAGLYCSNGSCSPLVDAGKACTRDGQCKGGICADGVCCNTRCTGQCEACDVTGTEGTCTPVADAAPHKGHPPCVTDQSACGGLCNGTSRDACVYPGPGVQCRAPECTAGVALTAAYCQGIGLCPPVEQVTCGTACVGNGCGNECTVDDQCGLSRYCLAGRCVPQRDNGSTCTSAGQCASSFCVDGTCCDEACNGQCEQCNGAGTEGVCTAATGAPKGVRPACAATDATCAGSCDGSDRAKCAYPGASTVCTPASCTGGVATLAQACAGNGSCAPLQQQLCAPYVCGGTKCAGNCTTDASCGAGKYCSAGVCVVKLGPGTPCAGNNQCGTGFCVDGVCCDKLCDGQCQACNDASNLGRCVAVQGRPHGARATCGGTAACEGVCNGKDVTACHFPGPAIRCGEAVCVDGTMNDAPSCNGIGTCIAGSSTDCFPFSCLSDQSACSTACATDADCAVGLVCRNGGCDFPPDAGAPRKDAGTPQPDAAVPADAGTGPGGSPSTDAGAVGTGGSAGTTGSGGAAGGSGGTTGSGGLVTDAGAGGHADAGDAGRNASAGDKGACGCRLDRSGGGSNAWLAAAALALVAARRRRTPRRDALPQR